MRILRHITAGTLCIGALAVAAAPSTAAAAVSSDSWRAGSSSSRPPSSKAHGPTSLAVDQRIVGTGEMAPATVAVTGTVNADGSMLVDLATPMHRA